MALPNLVQCVPFRFLLALVHVYFIGYFTAGGRIVTSWLESTPAAAQLEFCYILIPIIRENFFSTQIFFFNI